MKTYRGIVLAAAASLLVACKLQITAPATGIVVAESGDVSCVAGERCVLNITDTSFDQSFIGLPGAGYTFTGWKSEDRHFCGRRSGPCGLSTRGFESSEPLMSLLNGVNANQTFYLEPLFEPLALTGDIRVTNGTASSSEPSATALPGGGFVVTWVNGSVRARVFDASGSAVAPAFIVSQGEGAYITDPQVMAIGGDRIAFAYRVVGGNGNGDIYSRIFNSEYIAEGNEFLVNTETRYDQRLGGAAALRDGDYVVVWESINWDGAENDPTNGIYAQRVSTRGAFPTEVTTVVSADLLEAINPTVDGLAGGGFVVSWSQDLPGGRGAWTVLAQEFASRGYTIGDQFSVDPGSAGNHYYSRVVALAESGFAVLYEQLDPQPTNGVYLGDIYGQIFDAPGSGESFPVNVSTGGNQEVTGATVLADGSILAVWDGNGYAPDNSFGRSISSQGMPLGAELRINQQAGPTVSTEAITLADGRVVFTWERNSDVYMRILSAAN